MKHNGTNPSLKSLLLKRKTFSRIKLTKISYLIFLFTIGALFASGYHDVTFTPFNCVFQTYLNFKKHRNLKGQRLRRHLLLRRFCGAHDKTTLIVILFSLYTISPFYTHYTL